jgi:hypothetical protein
MEFRKIVTWNVLELGLDVLLRVLGGVVVVGPPLSKRHPVPDAFRGLADLVAHPDQQVKKADNFFPAKNFKLCFSLQKEEKEIFFISTFVLKEK